MNKYFSFRVKELRKRLGLTQQELADRAHCAQTTIGGIEAEHRGASMNLLIKIADALETTTDDLLTGKETK